MSDNKLPEVPIDVVNPKSYYAYLEKMEYLNTDEVQRWETSDPNIVVSLLMGRSEIAKAIKTLPSDEQYKILKFHDRVRRAKSSAARLKAKAYGITGRGKISTVSLIPKVRKSEIIELFGRYFTIQEVHRVVTHKWGHHDVSMDSLKEFREIHIELIKQRQEEYKRDISDIRLGMKRGRLEELVYLYRTRKIKFTLNDGLREDSREMRAILEQIRKEVEGDKITIDGNFNINQDSQIESHVFNQLLSASAIKSIIIARVAARLGVRSEKLLERLHRSYYSKYSGFESYGRSTSEDAKLIYPSQVMYEFDSLKQKSEDMSIIKEGDVEVVSKEESNNVSDVKAKLMSMLFSKKGKNNQDSID